MFLRPSPLVYCQDLVPWQGAPELGVHDPVPGVPPGVYEVRFVVPPLIVAEAGPSIGVVLSVVKWFTTRVVVLWHRLHVVALFPKRLRWKVCAPEL
jgi:hypothetical protein